MVTWGRSSAPAGAAELKGDDRRALRRKESDRNGSGGGQASSNGDGGTGSGGALIWAAGEVASRSVADRSDDRPPLRSRSFRGSDAKRSRRGLASGTTSAGGGEGGAPRGRVRSRTTSSCHGSAAVP